MLDYKKIFAVAPFSMPQREKEKWYYKYQKELTFYHYQNCIEYKKIADRIFGGLNVSKKLSDLLYIPVYLFKDFDLNSKNDQNSSKILTSSGTTGSKTSRIYLDRKTSLLQSRALSIIFSNILNVACRNVKGDSPAGARHGAGWTRRPHTKNSPYH